MTHSRQPKKADPIFAAIERVRRAELACDAENSPLSAGQRFWRARSAFVRTIPTTPAGVSAFVSYLREAQTRMCSAAPYIDETEHAEAFAATLVAAVNVVLGPQPRAGT